MDLNFFWLCVFLIADAQTEHQYKGMGSTSALYIAFRRKFDRPQFFLTCERMVKNIFLFWRSLLFKWALGALAPESRVRPSSLVWVVGLIWRPSMVSWRQSIDVRFRLNIISTVFAALTLCFSISKRDLMRSISCWSSLTAWFCLCVEALSICHTHRLRSVHKVWILPEDVIWCEWRCDVSSIRMFQRKGKEDFLVGILL